MFNLFAPLSAVAASFSIAAASVFGVPTPTQTVDTNAIKQSVFRIGIIDTAYVSGLNSDDKPRKVTVNGSCTAWAVDRDHLVTARHCVGLNDAKSDLAREFLGGLAEILSDDGPSALQSQLDFSNVQVKVVLATSDRSKAEQDEFSDVTLKVVDSAPSNGTDSALLEVSGLKQPLKPLPVARNAPPVLSTVVAVGYPGDISMSDSDLPLVFEPGSVAGTSTIDEDVNVTQDVTIVSAPSWHGMSGGPAVNKKGEVIGVNNAVFKPDPSFTFMTQLPELRAYLAEQHITTSSAPFTMPLYRWVSLIVIVGTLIYVIVFAAIKAVSAVRRRHPHYVAA